MQEMDYIKEAKNGLKFRELYGGIEDVLVPYMYLENTTRRVLVMEWVEGKKLSEVKDLYLVEEFTARLINFWSTDSIMPIHILETFFEHTMGN